MANNYLEQLVAEWYEYKGYFIRRNVNVANLEKVGMKPNWMSWAFIHQRNHLVHLEPSVDTVSWNDREKRFGKKFEAGRKHIPTLFEGFNLPDEIEHIAVFAYASKRNHASVSGGRRRSLLS